MTALLSAAQMQTVERAVIESSATTGRALMERAGRGVAKAIVTHFPGPDGRRAAILCGPGNNGGDGFVVARLLHEQGWAPQVFLLGDPDHLPPDARTNCTLWQQIGPVQPADAFASHVPGCDLIVDALFGTGLARPLTGPTAQLVQSMQGAAPVVAIDIPSGTCADSGRVLGQSARADLTVTFGFHKLGHHLNGASQRCGRVVLVPIGVEDAPLSKDVVTLIGQQDLALPPRLHPEQAQAHKYGHGHALVLTGTAGRTGAARLAARGALRIGAGLVTLGAPGSAFQEVACQITALMLRRVDNAEALDGLLQDPRFGALCLGPGLGSTQREQGLILAALESERPCVLDADALTGAFFETGNPLCGRLHAACILTPHGGEFARMFPDLADRLNAPADTGPAWSRVEAARAAARRAGCTVLLKGPDTVIATPENRCAIHSAQYGRTAPWLATAGSGDVLAGFITGLLAQGLTPFCAATTACWLHTECARAFGPGLIAEDLPEQLPRILAMLEPPSR